MASAIFNSTRQLVKEISTYIKIYNDGTIERPRNTPIVAPCPEDPETGVSSKDVIISVNPPISARIFIPKLDDNESEDEDQKLPILVYYRGGAFLYESVFSIHHYEYLIKIVSRARVIAVAVEYRNAPEHHLPAGYDDCWVGLQWVASHSTKSPPNIDPWLSTHANFQKIFIGGDSSGGNIVHNIALRAGSHTLPGGVKILGAYMNHPCFWSSQPIGPEPVDPSTRSMTEEMWALVYPSCPDGLDNPVLSPMGPNAPSLGTLGCSKMFISVAGKDLPFIKQNGILYYEAVERSGWEGEVELFVEKEEDHVYHLNHPESHNAHKLYSRIVEFLHQ